MESKSHEIRLDSTLTFAHVRYQIENHVDFVRSKLYLLASEIQGDVTNARSLSSTVESARRTYFA